MIVAAIIIALFNQYLPFLISSDSVVISPAAQCLISAGLFPLFDGTQVVGLGVLRGMGDVNIPTLITFVAYWIIGLPSGYVMGITLGWGVHGVWYGLTLGLLTSSLLLYWRYRYMIRKQLESSFVAG